MSKPKKNLRSLTEQDNLTPKELEILQLLTTTGYSNLEIAQKMGTAEGTVKKHVFNIMNKLDVKSRSQAGLRARELNLFPSEEIFPRFFDLKIVGESNNVVNLAEENSSIAIAPPHNLPAQINPLIGRSNEVAGICALLAQENIRLVTLTGSGGMGKTRLAQEVGWSRLTNFQHEVWFVELATFNDPQLIIYEIARHLGLEEQKNQPFRETLANVLGEHQILLILDNCEHLLEEVAELVSYLLRTAPLLKVLTTSRESLQIKGETTYLVTPLAFPRDNQLNEFTNLANYPAMQLFVARATAIHQEFTLNDVNIKAVREICQQLDGLPLALELAAARINILSVEQIRERLNARFRLLTVNNRDQLPRQRSLKALIDWSYDLLTKEEQQAFKQLAIFKGGHTLEAAEELFAGMALNSGAIGLNALEMVTALTSKSLIYRNETDAGEPRFHMLESIHEYATELLAMDQTENNRLLYLTYMQYFQKMAETAAVELRGPEQQKWLKKLTAETDNIRKVISWAVQEKEANIALSVSSNLWRFWWMSGLITEGEQWLKSTLIVSEEVAPQLKALGLFGLSTLKWVLADYAAAAEICAKSLEIYRVLADKEGISKCLNILALCWQNLGKLNQAELALEEGLKNYEFLQNKHGVATTLNSLGLLVCRLEQFDRAKTLFEESMAIYKKIGDKKTWVLAYSNLGMVMDRFGDYTQAAQIHTECLKQMREIGSKHNICDALLVLGRDYYKLKNYTQTLSLYQECIQLFHETRDKSLIVDCLEGVSAIALKKDKFNITAVEIVAAADRICKDIGLSRTPHGYIEKDLILLAQSKLDAIEFKAAWGRGELFKPKEALDIAANLIINLKPI